MKKIGVAIGNVAIILLLPVIIWPVLIWSALSDWKDFVRGLPLKVE